MPLPGDPSLYLRALRSACPLLDQPPPALEAALSHSRLLLAGPAHSGKSAFLRHVANLWAAGLEDARTWSLLFPIHLSLPSWAGHIAASGDASLARYLDRENARSAWGLPEGYLGARLPAAFLFAEDLGDLAAPALIRAVRLGLEELAARHPHSRFLVTARAAAPPSLAGFHTVWVSPRP